MIARLPSIASRPCWRWMAAVLLLVGALRPPAGAGQAPLVTGHALESLLIGPDELPWELTLRESDSGAGQSAMFQAGASSYSASESWRGQGPGPRSGREITITWAIAETPREAQDAVERQAHSYQAIFRELTGQPSVAAFTDRAWYPADRKIGGRVQGAHLLFARANVAVSVWMWDGRLFPDTLIFALAAKVARKIDAARGNASALRVLLPPAGAKVSVAAARRALAARGARGQQALDIAFQEGMKRPLLLPARRAGKDDYVVSLNHLVAIFHPAGGVAVQGDLATARLAGRSLVLHNGGTEIVLDGTLARLGRPAQFSGSQVLVPLGLVEKVLHRRIHWSVISGKVAARV